ncbi:MAG TPA: metalloregulator ArsR/SmtB family transcription factor [Rhizomicrobium sp.]|jgi:DNA-binding transcriptional ArsR family regulator
MPQTALPQEAVFKALADPTRREILALLRQGRQPAGAIAGRFPVSRPAISKHLRLLREAKLVVEAREGRARLYQLNPAPLKSVDDWIAAYRRYWRTQLGNLRHFVETQTDEA